MSKLKQIRTKNVRILLDKERSLCFDLNAYAELEDMYGTVSGALEALNSGSIKAIRAVLWTGLIHEESNDDGTYNLTLKQVGAMIDGQSLPVLMEIINASMNESAPEEDEEDVTQGN